MLIEDIGGVTMEVCLELIDGASMHAIKTNDTSKDALCEILYAADKVIKSYRHCRQLLVFLSLKYLLDFAVRAFGLQGNSGQDLD
jgi:hypothetical protein